MKNKKDKKTLRKKKPIIKRKTDYKWVITITISAFLISLLFSFFSELVVTKVNVVIAILLTIIVILIGVIFDMIGISVTVSNVGSFNSMSTKRVKGAKLGSKLIKNSEKVSSFCNDVIGDICGIISGALASSISMVIASKLGGNVFIITLIVTALVAALTIGGKALGKSVAINRSHYILYKFSKFLANFVKN